jgi:hypothetical protein
VSTPKSNNDRAKSLVQLNRQVSQVSGTSNTTNVIPYYVNRKIGLQFKKCFVRRQINNIIINMAAQKRKQAELEAYHQFKQIKENADILYLID